VIQRSRRDPFTTSIAVLTALVVVGLVGLGIAWRGVAASLVVAIQLPYAVSGAMGGIALIGFALGLLAVQSTRRNEALERAQMARFSRAAADLLADLRESDA
jgi:hypothetical protein